MTLSTLRSLRALPHSAQLSAETLALLRLGVPLALTHLSYIATISTDVMMMGWLGPEALATGSLAWYLYVFFDYFAIGILGAVSPILAQHLGARRTKDIRPTVRAGAWTAGLLAVPCCAILWHSEHILTALGQSTSLAADAQSYLRYVLIAMLPGLWLFVLSEHLAAHGRTRAMLLTYVAGIGLNALANYALMFGKFGFPALGLVGAPTTMLNAVFKCDYGRSEPPAEMSERVTSEAIQLCGAQGYGRNLPVERMFRDVRCFTLAGGSAEMQRLGIATRVLGRSIPQHD